MSAQKKLTRNEKTKEQHTLQASATQLLENGDMEGLKQYIESQEELFGKSLRPDPSKRAPVCSDKYQIEIDASVYKGELGKKRKEREGNFFDLEIKQKVQRVEQQVEFDPYKIHQTSESSSDTEDLEQKLGKNLEENRFESFESQL